MKKHYLIFIFSVFLILISMYPSYAQSKLWGITYSSSGGSVYYTDKDGSHFTKTFSMDYNGRAGRDPNFLLQGSEGIVYGINNNGTIDTGEGVLFKIDKSGVKRICSLPYPVSSRASIVELNGYLYGIGPALTATGGRGVVFRVKTDGTNYQSSEFAMYPLNTQGAITRTTAGDIFGMSERGGANGMGFIYKIKHDVSGIQVIYNFNKSGGKRPFGKLTEGPDGFLYGLTNSGGAHNYGAIFKISTDGQQYIKLHDFNITNGSYPTGGLLIGPDGHAYGTTSKGGKHKKGLIFKIGTDGTGYTILHHFDGVNGSHPAGDLALDEHNALFGYADGGAFNEGILFSIKTDGSDFNKIKDFQGESPQGNLLLIDEGTANANVALTSPADNAKGSAITGTFKCNAIIDALNYTLQLSEHADFKDSITVESTTNNFLVPHLKFGTQYYARVKTSIWPSFGKTTTFTTRDEDDYVFISKPVNGAIDQPTLNLKITANVVPGASRYTIQVSPTPDFADHIVTDSSSKDGQRTLVFSNLSYSTLYYVRARSNLSDTYGRVSTFTTQAEEFIQVTAPIAGSTNNDPSLITVSCSPITGANSYTVALSTTSDFSSGTVIRTSVVQGQSNFNFKNLNPSTQYFIRAKSDVSTTYGPITEFRTREQSGAQRLWGLTTAGGAYNLGTIFSFSVDSLKFTKHLDYYHEYDYAALTGSLTQTPKGFAGLSIAMGTGGGEVFTLTKNGSFDLVETYGPHDGSVMLGSDNYLYIVDDWINMFRGGIYKIYLDGDDVESLDRIIFRFRSDWQGASPTAQLLELPDGYLYGTAPNRGAHNKGTLYRLKMDGQAHEVIHTFNGTDGAHPEASLTIGADGYLYGLTPEGGVSNGGVIFKMLPDGSDFSLLYEFNGVNGKNPYGSLIWHNNKLYGTASMGGMYDKGVVFNINPDGTQYTRLIECNGITSAHPMGALTVDDNGLLYGMSSAGGNYNLGTIFRLRDNGASFETLFSFTAESGSSPNGSVLVMEDTFTPPAFSLAADSYTVEQADQNVLIYPNPFTGYFTTRVNNKNEVRLTISDHNGAVVIDTNAAANSTLQLGDHLERGIYILKITHGSEVSTHRMIKN